MRRSFLAVAGVLMVCLVVPARADLIGERSLTVSWYSPASPQYAFINWYLASPSFPIGLTWLIEPSSVGSTSTSSWQAGFADVVNMLTNGTDEEFEVRTTVFFDDTYSLDLWDSWYESTMRIAGTTPGPGPDFRGCIIDEIEMFTEVMSEQELWVRFRIEGKAVPVPLPGAVLLGALGLGVAGWRLRRREMA